MTTEEYYKTIDTTLLERLGTSEIHNLPKMNRVSLKIADLSLIKRKCFIAEFAQTITFKIYRKSFVC